MLLDQILAEIAEMPKEQQDQLAAFLVHLRHARDPQFSQQVASKIEDSDSSNWVSLDELKEHWSK
jgi:hypothetical protein